ncbi:MAG: TetR/AcrR family transcriptional regulator [Elusimicrobiota bacterium]
MKKRARKPSSAARYPPPSERRLAILRAAADVLRGKDYHDLTMEDVARRAGVAKGTLYLYFPAKEDLFKAVAKDMFRTAVARWESIRARTAPGLERVRALLRAQLEFFEENREIFVQVFQGNPPLCLASNPRERGDMIMANVHVLADALAEAMALKLLRRADAQEAAVCLFGMIRGFVFARILGGMGGPLQGRAGFVWDSFYRGMKP